MISNNGKTVRLKRTLNVDVETLYRAWSTPTAFQAWWKGMIVKEMDFRAGGTYSLGWASSPADYAKGEYKEVIPNKKIVMTWSTSDQCAGKKSVAVTDSLITLNFEKAGDKTSTLELVHDLLPTVRVGDHHWGWTDALADLDRAFNSHLKIKPELKAEVSRAMPAPVDKVWAAWTDPKMMVRWFNRAGATQGTADGELKVGGWFFMDYQFQDGNVHRLHCKYLEIVPREKLVFTWLDDNTAHPEVDRAYETRVTVRLTAIDAKQTMVSIVHDHLRAESGMKSFQGGWTACLASMQEELEKDRG